ncbi:TonB dependent receptor [compost metagenome]
MNGFLHLPYYFPSWLVTLRTLCLVFLMLMFFTMPKARAASIKTSEPTKTKKLAKILVKGKVSDESTGETLPGVSIRAKGTNIGTVTNASGEFSLNVEENSILTISYMGYKTAEVTAKENTTLDIKLERSENSLDEVVLVGYGTVKRADLTGSIASLKGKDLEDQPNVRTDQALQGRVAGVVVQNNNGGPEGDVSIRIRGANSLTYGNDPLIIVDGIQNASIATINPNDIKSIDVLKDAAALSIYGARGTNGVILITTKNGKDSPFTVAYDSFVSSDRVRKKLGLLDAKTYATFLNEAQTANGYNPIFTQSELDALGKGTDWQNEIFQTGVTQSHNLSISGFSDKISYYVSGNVLDRTGVIINSAYKQYTLRSNLNIKATSKLTFGLNTFASYDINHSGDPQGAVRSALSWSPTKPVYESNGKYSQPGGGVGPNGVYNPVGMAKEIVDDRYNKSFTFAPSAEYQIIPSLKFKSIVAYKVIDRFSGYFNNQVVNAGPASAISGSTSMSQYSSLQNSNILTYDKKISDHSINITAVYETLQDQYRGSDQSAQGIPINLGYNGLSYATTTPYPQPRNEIVNTATRSLMGRINYSYKDRYLITISDRYDGASQLADGHKFENFGAVAIAWNIMNENFMKKFKNTIQDLKIRASYGAVGNAAVPAYASQQTFFPGLDANGNPTLTIRQLANPNLKWERTTEKNLAIDGSFLNNRLQFTAEYYDKKTTDLLLFKAVPTGLGVSSILSNIGSVSNRGFDFSVGGTPISKKNFKWESTVTFNLNKNKILALAGTDTVYNSFNDFPGVTGSFALIAGQPISSFLGYEFAGLWKSNEASTAALYGAKPGDAKYVDVNNDGVIDKEDIKIIGSAQPKFNYGWTNTFRYKNIDLNIFFQGVFGNQIYNLTQKGTGATGTQLLTQWREGDEDTDIPSVTGRSFSNSSYWVEDGSYLRLKNITLGYTLPSSILAKSKVLSSAKIFFSTTNLITFTNYSGYDPESSTGVDTNGGVDLNVYPSQKSFTFGLNIKFK